MSKEKFERTKPHVNIGTIGAGSSSSSSAADVELTSLVVDGDPNNGGAIRVAFRRFYTASPEWTDYHIGDPGVTRAARDPVDLCPWFSSGSGRQGLAEFNGPVAAQFHLAGCVSEKWEIEVDGGFAYEVLHLLCSSIDLDGDSCPLN